MQLYAQIVRFVALGGCEGFCRRKLAGRVRAQINPISAGYKHFLHHKITPRPVDSPTNGKRIGKRNSWLVASNAWPPTGKPVHGSRGPA